MRKVRIFRCEGEGDGDGEGEGDARAARSTWACVGGGRLSERGGGGAGGGGWDDILFGSVSDFGRLFGFVYFPSPWCFMGF